MSMLKYFLAGLFLLMLGVIIGPGVQLFNLSFGISFGYFLAEQLKPLIMPCAIVFITLLILVPAYIQLMNPSNKGVEDYIPKRKLGHDV